MKRITYPQLAYLTVVSAINVALAYRFGTDGYEVFLITAWALTILFSWLSLQLLRRLFSAKIHLVLKLLGVLPIIFLWLFGIGVGLMTALGGVENPQVATPQVNAALVLAGIVPYLVPRIGLYVKDANATHICIGLTATFMSIFVLYLAIVLFQDPRTVNGGFLLVLATQLQLVMNYLLTRTNYVTASHAFTGRLFQRLGINDEKWQGNIELFATGLPFFAPAIVVLMVGTVGY